MTHNNNRNYYGILIHGGIKTKKIASMNQSAETIKNISEIQFPMDSIC